MILFHTALAVTILVGIADGLDRFGARTRVSLEQDRRDDLIRRGYILWKFFTFRKWDVYPLMWLRTHFVLGLLHT